jgi:hypothetical protein
MRRALVVVLLLGSSCSLLFDPSRVDAGGGSGGGSGGGGGAGGGGRCEDSCPSLPNATASCVAEACTYACVSPFRDGDGDLTDGGTSGCELNCGVPGMPVNPSTLVATVGAPGLVELTWPQSGPAGATPLYLLCVGPTFEVCQTLSASAACVSGQCRLVVPGLPNNTRLRARVMGATPCAVAPQATAQTVSFTPINSFQVNVGGVTDALTIASGCGATVLPVANNPPEIRVEQTGLNCTTTLTGGDELWTDGALQVEMLIPSLADSPTLAGLVSQMTANGHVVSSTITVPRPDLDRGAVVSYRQSGTADPLVGSSALYRMPGNTWVTLRLIAVGGVFSMQVISPPSTVAQELIRWPSPLGGAAAQGGRPGMVVYGAGKAQFRNFRVTTFAVLPQPGATSVSYPLGGGMLPGDWYLRGGPPVVQYESCPAFPLASRCDGGCAAVPTGGCANLPRERAGFGLGGTASFDFPVGIDVRQPFRVAMRMAAQPTDAGNFFAPELINTTHGPLFSAGSGVMTCAGTAVTTAPMEINTWHELSWRFEGDGGITCTYDGAQQTVPLPATWDRHPGALMLSSPAAARYYNAWVTNVTVSQP